VSDFFISSYTPTVSALLQRSNESSKHFSGLLAVSQSNTPHMSPLPAVREELEMIRLHAGDHKVDYLEDDNATADVVLHHMSACSWVHLACHAIQDPRNPMKSAFCLRDGQLHLSTIITKSLPHADFAFLSCCQTAMGDEMLSDEAVHLAAGMLLSGYRSVIATIWSIRDQDGPLIAGQVYSELLSSTEPDSSRAAEALHHAVGHLREKVGELSFLSWVPFIHIGI
jgi:CHAT domain-containing protein